MDAINTAKPAAARAGAAPPASVATLAKGAWHRLVQTQLEPTPDNYARAYAAEAGVAAPVAAPNPAAADLKIQGRAWSDLVEKLARQLDRGGKQWTGARRRDSLKRLLEGSRSDPQRVLQRLQSLLAAWEADTPADPALTGIEEPPLDAAQRVDTGAWPPLVASLQSTVRAALPADVPQAAALALALAARADAVAADGATPEHAAAIEVLCQQARRLFGQRHHLIDELGKLCRELAAGLAEVAEDGGWVQGQCESLQTTLGDAGDYSVRGLRAAAVLLAETRQQQQALRGERQAAREALKQLIRHMLQEVGELGDTASRFQQATALRAQTIEQADSLESLAAVVNLLLQDTRTVEAAAAQSQHRLRADHGHASALEVKVRELESELLRLSEEVSTDALTQVANRRGLVQVFEVERARSERQQAQGGAGLAVGLIDVDNFKKLNDTLGHAAGDVALKTLAAAVRERLRPVDHLARFGGEEFVVLLPGVAVAEAQLVLTRLQRALSEALFLHDGREVFVTFSAGVSDWRRGEALQTTLERADEALYEAKRSGKNRTCIG